MPLFKNKQDPPADPSADPGNGDPPADSQYMTMEQFQQQMEPFNKTLETVNKTLETLGKQPAYQPQQAPSAPAEDPFKSQRARIAEIDKELAGIPSKAESAAYEGKGMGELMDRQQKLMLERSEVQGQIVAGQGDPRIDAGFQALDAISTEVTAGKMTYLSVPEVKDRYEFYINQLPPDQRMNPQSKIGCYNLAVGENYQKVQELDKQAWLREQEEPPTQAPSPGGPSGRQQPSGSGDEFTPESFFSPEALKSIKQSRHRTVDNYVRALGYDGWGDYVEKNKDYMGEEEEA